MTGPYDDIIHLPHSTSAKHPRMSIAARAAMFSPFAALSGHGAAIEETAQLTGRRIELSEEAKTELDMSGFWRMPSQQDRRCPSPGSSQTSEKTAVNM